MLMSVSPHPGITFAVDPVEPATELLPELKEGHAIEQQLGAALEAFWPREGRFIGSGDFVGAIHMAYDHHYPLVISPDHLWLFLLQGFSIHVHTHAEELRESFVPHSGSEALNVRRDDFIPGNPDNAWQEVVAELFSQIKERAKGHFVESAAQPFSTTDVNEQTAFQIALLGIYGKYFSYNLHTMCGIPSIRLEGTVADWQDLRQRVDLFSGYGLEDWLAVLRPILDEFVQAASGNANREFWRSIYKDVHLGSGGPYLTGWIVKLMPYIFSGGQMVLNPYLDWQPGDSRKPMTLSQLPRQILSVPFTWMLMEQSHQMHFYSGFMGIQQDPETLGLRPQIGWAIRDVEAWNQFEKSFMDAFQNAPNHEERQRILDSAEARTYFNGVDWMKK